MAVVKSDNPEKEEKNKEKGLSIERQNNLLNRMDEMSKTIDELKKGGGNSNINKQLVEALKELKGDPSRSYDDAIDASGYLNLDSIDPEDVLEGADIVRFYAYKSNYVIVDDKRQGRYIQTPFKNGIMFEHVGTKTTGVGKYKETEHSCVYNCKSKKEAKWLKDHSLFGVAFYASGGDGHIMSVSSKKASKMASLMNNLKTQDRFSIINMCKQHGIELTEDAGEMRIALANKLSEQVDSLEVSADEERVKEMLMTKKELGEIK